MASTDPKELAPKQLTAEEYRFLSKRPYYNNVLIDSRELALRVSLDEPRRWTPAKKPCASLGMLGMLPLEIQLHLFSITPVSTLFDLRATNSHARQLIEQWPPFRTAMTEGSDAVRALVATGAGNLWTTQQVVHVLFTTKCEFCGEHGEILQLLKLKRCCFRCLSQERELLAISERYTCEVMKLEPSELAQLPLLRSVPQKRFWGFPARERRWLFDFNSALKVVRQRPREQGHRPPAPPRIGPMMLQQTGKRLNLKECSVQRRPKQTIQLRRGQRPLRLMSEEVSPLETVYAQHACAIRIPGKKRQTTRLPKGGLQVEISTVEAVHCAGCAFYWNYHSPLPWQFHRLYPHQPGKTDTPFTHHLEYCVYAKLQWSWLHNPWTLSHPVDIIIYGDHNMMQSRTDGPLGPEDNAHFEEIDSYMQKFIDAAEVVCAEDFAPPDHWPRLESRKDDESSSDTAKSYNDRVLLARQKEQADKELLQRIRAREPSSSIEQLDSYYDCLVSQEAISQANWACANMASGKACLFGGPVVVMMDKHESLLRKGCWMPALGLGQMYM
ncbi:hypothetical protein A1O7_06626 [Cladophialophora yegresii CBS 114405]|uniref:F-box domain-containing protein n=1 Tax=Cladophialophora yegresii CBS 114405 TaxID=1182544 RepID=W9WL44_9EURO|nr:uncharacterized protein A1O7_06626 [Cladophialophora yegresii CBS 114405]EXJ59194.1 hypothetical protein A1O7_06626 [Cladophialophora yegresii CBS 114405]